MIDDLRALAIFSKVAEEGSFSAAGRALRLSTSVVSHHVKVPQTRHGVSLFRRSTRALSLTSEGQDCYTLQGVWLRQRKRDLTRLPTAAATLLVPCD